MVSDDWNYSLIVHIDVLQLPAGEPRDGEVVFNAGRAVYLLRPYFDPGHLDTVNGLGLVQKLRNDVCTRSLELSKFGRKLWEQWPRSLYCSDGVYIADRSSGPRGDLGVTA